MSHQVICPPYFSHISQMDNDRRFWTRRDFVSAAAVGAGAAIPALISNPVLAHGEPLAAKEGDYRNTTIEAAAPQLDKAGATSESVAVQRSYSTVNQKSWDDILADNALAYTPPLTVHLPIQPIHNPDFVHVDCALNVCRRRVFPNLLTAESDAHRAAVEHEILLMQFALENPPFVPDFRLSRLSLVDGRFPLALANYFVWELLYEFEYCCTPLADNQSLLWTKVSVTNESRDPQIAHVRGKLNFGRESEFFDYHYVPFCWDRLKWRPDKRVGLQGDAILRNKVQIGRILANGWTVRWEAKAHFDEKEYRRRFSCNVPYVAPSNLRLQDIQNVVHFSTELKSAEKRSFWIALLTNYEGATPDQHARLLRAQPERDRAVALQHFQSQIGSECTQMTCPIDRWDSVFAALQLSTLQLMVQFPGEKYLMPTGGGSTERHFVWTWEAMFMLQPMLRLGHFRPVRRSLDYLFRLQDGGCPPQGRLTTTAGAIGTTGQKWLNTTGSALALAADYYLYSRDETFLDAYLPKILKAMGWIVGEVRATRKLNLDGSRPPYYGLMPFGCATDGDIGYFFAFTDAYTFRGLEKAVNLLEHLGHARAGEFRQELETYRADLDRATQAATRSDGYIERRFLTDDESQVTEGFEAICGAVNLAYAGVLDIHTEHFRRFVAYVEEHMMDGYFTGRMDHDIAYMGIGELNWHHTYLRLGEWKKAFVALRNNLRYAMTQDTLQVQERFSRRDPAFTPWQPNSSGNGRILEMMLNCFFLEHDGMATILGGIPFAWLAKNGVTSLKNLYTARGELSVSAQMLDDRRCRLSVYTSSGGVLPRLIRLPEHFEASNVSSTLVREGGGRFQISEKARELSLVVREGESRSGAGGGRL